MFPNITRMPFQPSTNLADNQMQNKKTNAQWPKQSSKTIPAQISPKLPSMTAEDRQTEEHKQAQNDNQENKERKSYTREISVSHSGRFRERHRKFSFNEGTSFLSSFHPRQDSNTARSLKEIFDSGQSPPPPPSVTRSIQIGGPLPIDTQSNPGLRRNQQLSKLPTMELTGVETSTTQL